jgi:hypothetical protein
MQLLDGNRKDFEKRFNDLAPAAKQLLRGSAVALAYSGGSFNASGVIFYYDGTGASYILTAKHNLLLGQPFKPGETPAPSTFVQDFTNKVKILYGFVDFTNKAPKSADFDKSANNGGNNQIFGSPDEDNWTYDVMMVKSMDAALLDQAKLCAVAKSQGELDILSARLALQGLALKRASKHEYIQTGCGYSHDNRPVSDKYLGKFQVRYTNPNANVIAEEVYEYYEKEKFNQVNTNIAMLEADNDNSTAPGDSGGALFQLDKNKATPEIFLLGVTFGANQSLVKNVVVPDLPIQVNSSSYLAKFICDAFPNSTGC